VLVTTQHTHEVYASPRAVQSYVVIKLSLGCYGLEEKAASPQFRGDLVHERMVDPCANLHHNNITTNSEIEISCCEYEPAALLG
jgi:hypothetical protein